MHRMERACCKVGILALTRPGSPEQSQLGSLSKPKDMRTWGHREPGRHQECREGRQSGGVGGTESHAASCSKVSPQAAGYRAGTCSLGPLHIPRLQDLWGVAGWHTGVHSPAQLGQHLREEAPLPSYHPSLGKKAVGCHLEKREG